MNTLYDQLKRYADSHWGLILSKNRGRGYYHGDWKSGYSLSGVFPGEQHCWRRYSTLKQVARVLGYKQGK